MHFSSSPSVNHRNNEVNVSYSFGHMVQKKIPEYMNKGNNSKNNKGKVMSLVFRTSPDHRLSTTEKLKSIHVALMALEICSRQFFSM